MSIYVVQSGDTIDEIALAYGTDTDSIFLNRGGMKKLSTVWTK